MTGSHPVRVSLCFAGALSEVVDTGPGRGPSRGVPTGRGGGGGRRGVAFRHQRPVGAAGGGLVRRAAVPLRPNQESVLRVCKCCHFLLDLGNWVSGFENLPHVLSLGC